MSDELIHILLVEDDEIEREALRRAFKQQQIINPLVCVTTGQEALYVLRGENGYSQLPRPYIILTDINMPQMPVTISTPSAISRLPPMMLTTRM